MYFQLLILDTLTQDEGDALVSVKITTLEDAGALQYYNGSSLGRCYFKPSNYSF